MIKIDGDIEENYRFLMELNKKYTLPPDDLEELRQKNENEAKNKFKSTLPKVDEKEEIKENEPETERDKFEKEEEEVITMIKNRITKNLKYYDPEFKGLDWWNNILYF